MPTTPKDAELSPYMWGVLGYAAASRRPVYNVKGYLVQSVKALQRCGLVVVDPDGRIRLTDAGNSALAQERQRPTRETGVLEGLTFYWMADGQPLGPPGRQGACHG
jgi:hypothetical protein